MLCTKLRSVDFLRLSKCFLIVVKMWTKETRFVCVPFVEINVYPFVLVVLFCIALCWVELYRVALYCIVYLLFCVSIYCLYGKPAF